MPDDRFLNGALASVLHRYSAEIAVLILKQLEQDPDCKIYDNGWKSSRYGNLVENGITVSLGTMKFKIIRSYEDLLIL